ncbi:MAG: hypothetical protein WEB06_12785 [Actinomycetota bacterium]
MDERFDPSSWLALARRRAWIVLLTVVAGMGGAAAVTRVMPPSYEAVATMFVGSTSPSGEPGADIAYASLAQSLVTSYRQLAETRSIALEAATRAGLEPRDVVGRVTAEAQPGVQVLSLHARAATPARAAQLANAVADALAARVETLSGAAGEHVGLELVDPAVPPRSLDSPRMAVNVSFGALVGLLVGIGVSFALESLNPRIRTTGDVQRELGVPTLGTFPYLRRRAREVDVRLWHTVPAVAEPCRSLAVTLASIAEREGHRRILITSTRTEEGKTTVAGQLALALAEQERRTALVEGDLHRPALWRHFPPAAGARIDPAGGRSSRSPLRSADVSPNLTVVLSDGKRQANSARASEFARSVSGALGDYEHVLIDAPPALAVSDTRVLAQHVDAVLFVVRAGATGANDARAALAALRQLDVKIAGVVLVGVRGRQTDAYYYADGGTTNLSALGAARRSSG